MTVPEGHFQLYSKIDPALKAGDYRFSAAQTVSATDDHGPVAADQLPVLPLDTFVRVTSPRYQLPPDQILSTYPPAGTEGAYGARLPQVVIKRRTLPWERTVTGAPAGTPWLALVVFAEGEAELLSNVPVADCITAGKQLAGPVDVEKGACLQIRQSVINRIMPTRKDVPLLAHAREVNINDTELMMGDDDGFLAVVIANRLPLAAKNPDGSEAPVKYVACLVNLEEQFPALLEKSPPAVLLTDHLVLEVATELYSTAEYDHVAMNTTKAIGPAAAAAVLPHADERDAPEAQGIEATAVRTGVAKEAMTTAFSGSGSWATAAREQPSEFLTTGVGYQVIVGQLLDPTLRFPVLAHWSFTSVGNKDFQYLMQHTDSGLIGTQGQQPKPVQGRPPLEVVETGHVGIDQRTRRGDVVRAWYRGPLLPHPADLTSPRLPLAHTGDQLRAVIPDGREDLSLAAGFEIGRLLALSQPSMVAALLRWRQVGYQTARSSALWGSILDGFALEGMQFEPGRLLGSAFGRGLAMAVTRNPADTIGPPREVFTAGTPMGFDGDAMTLVARGLGVEVAADVPLATLLENVRATTVPTVPLADLTKGAATSVLTGALGQVRDSAVLSSVSGALSTHLAVQPGVLDVGLHVGGVLGGVPVVMPHAGGQDEPDALDRALRGHGPSEEEDPS